MSGVLYVVHHGHVEGVVLAEWHYKKETARQFSGGFPDSRPHYRTIVKKDPFGVPRRGYRRTPADAVQAYVDECSHEAQRCRDRAATLEGYALIARGLVSP